MPARLNKPLEQYLAELQEEWGRAHVIPSYGRLSAVFGLKSKNAVSNVLQNLEEAGYLQKFQEITETGANQLRWAPTSRFFRREFMRHHIKAGAPEEIPEEVPDADGAKGIDEYLIEQPNVTSFFEAEDEAMSGVGILPGDICVIRKASTAQTGKHVVAQVDDRLVLRTLRVSPNGPYLHPENPAFDDIWPTGELQIRGVLVGMFRKFENGH